MKVLDVMGLRKGIRDSESGLHTLEQQVKEIRQRVGEVVGLDDAFQGKGAQAIRSFYEELHLPFLLFLEGFITDYQDVLKEMDSALQSLESDEDGYIHQEFLEDDLVAGLKKAERVTMSLTDDTNAVIKSVKDIVSLPLLDDEEFLLTVTEGRSQIYDTVEQLHNYDRDQSDKLENVEHDVQVMKQYLEKINEKRASGELNVSSYSVKQLSGTGAFDELLEGLKRKGIEANVLDSGADEKEFLSKFTSPLTPKMAAAQVQREGEKRTVHCGVQMIGKLEVNR